MKRKMYEQLDIGGQGHVSCRYIKAEGRTLLKLLIQLK